MVIPFLPEILKKNAAFLGYTMNTTLGFFIYKPEKFRLDPPYQRPDVWTNEQRESLIRSMFFGIPIPPIIVNRVMGMERAGWYFFHVIDGRQRLTTLFDFLNDKFSVDGVKYSDLTDVQKNEFEMSNLPTIETRLDTLEEEEAYYNIFNFAGTSH